ncbi:MAG: hypothetical protein HWQ39_27025, partial [Nostoc sp. NMS8]|nr:hypothetical protein [Nostoc sp. NMS8]
SARYKLVTEILRQFSEMSTVSLYTLIEEEYQVSQFQGSDRIISPTFPELNLTAEQIFQAGGYPV